MNKVEVEYETGVVRVPGWEELSWLRHGFSTRAGGVSTVYLPQGLQEQSSDPEVEEELPDRDLNLGLTKDDHPEYVAENRRRLVFAVTGFATTPLIIVRQVHSATSLVVAQPISHSLSGLLSTEGHAMRQGDGLMTNVSGVLLGIQTADCVPVLVVDTRNRAVAAFHAGWRGTVARIVEHGVAKMISDYGSRPEDLIAAVGPSIGTCCYTVGEQVEAEFTGAFSYGASLFRQDSAVPAALVPGAGRRPSLHLDLWEANRRQLLDCGLATDRITVVGECTGCTGLPGRRRYFSHRAEHGFTGRMMNVVGIFN